VFHFLKYLEENHPMEVVGLVALGPSDVGQPLAVPLTRDYGDIRKALYAHASHTPHTYDARASRVATVCRWHAPLTRMRVRVRVRTHRYSIELCASDATDADAGLTEALRQIYVRFGNDMAPTQIIFITDAMHHSVDSGARRPLTNALSHGTSVTAASHPPCAGASHSSLHVVGARGTGDDKVDMELPSSVKLHVVALGADKQENGALRKRQRTSTGDGAGGSAGAGMLRRYQKLATLQGGEFHLVEAPHAAPQLKQTFDSIARAHCTLSCVDVVRDARDDRSSCLID
jgi:hypothetical protein